MKKKHLTTLLLILFLSSCQTLFGSSNGINGGSVGFNLGNGYSNRAWVDQVSSIIGTNSVEISVGTKDESGNYIDNTGNTNIVGAVIANKDKDGNDLGNLNLSTASLTYSDLKNFSVSESNQLGLNLQVGFNPNNPTQNGNLAINLSMQGSESSSDTKATIGQGNITVGGNLNDETKLAGLNRDIANIEQNKKTLITSDFEAELKIDLRLLAAAGNLMVGNTAGATANWNSYANDTKKGYDILTSDQAKDVYRKVWASPNTALGLAYGGTGYLYGALTGQDVKVSIGNNAVQFEGNPLGQDGAAITLGNTISYFGNAKADDTHPTYEANNLGYRRDINNTVILGKHEQEHTYQYERLGPLFLPIYLFYGIADPKNPFEQSADKVGNQFYRNQYDR